MPFDVFDVFTVLGAMAMGAGLGAVVVLLVLWLTGD